MTTTTEISSAHPAFPESGPPPRPHRRSRQWMQWAAAAIVVVALLGCVAALVATAVERDALRADLNDANSELRTREAELAETAAVQIDTAEERDACAGLAGLYQKIVLLLVAEIDANAADPRDPIDMTESASYASLEASLPCLVVSH